MQPTLIAVIVIVGAFFTGVISVQRKLTLLDENTCNAMNQIGVQLSGIYDALNVLLDLVKDFDMDERESLIELINSKRIVVAAKSIPEDVRRQEAVISEMLERIAIVLEKYPESKTDQKYAHTMGAIETFESMMVTSRLIYNDSVAKLNRAIRKFPTFLAAELLGYRQKEYLEKDKRNFQLSNHTDKEEIKKL